ncbi:type IV secretory pathway protease TraF-like protein (plasmid) [Rhizorhabdus wittichii RW1]|uniref:Type IV secretory pathway protease TraF-like protein n=1 Tax=Rhizorhabdus wittichii (strain DSM 6014 / CCUG 31198 / JCM 15750 / NBRC 105917 / EY 4224 / RW1) TaxID=392499 RepID=A0A9J9HGQ7_RHIWR|nr:type IV secretory pathway protease TraF-like protein [Rhizorhabdus wittichii RW1]
MSALLSDRGETPVVPARAAPAWRPRKHLWAALGLLSVGTVVLGAIADWRDRHAFLINTSESLPNWAFLIDRGRMPARGDYVFFDPPATALVHRHFGARPAMFGKLVYGLPGDVVSHSGNDVLIEGRLVARMKRASRLGELLTPGATGPVPAGCYFVGTPHKDGFDSRYADIGFVCARRIIGTGKPLL